MSEVYGDNGEVWPGEDDDPQLGGMGSNGPPTQVFRREWVEQAMRSIPWYVRLWRWVVGA